MPSVCARHVALFPNTNTEPPSAGEDHMAVPSLIMTDGIIDDAIGIPSAPLIADTTVTGATPLKKPSGVGIPSMVRAAAVCSMQNRIIAGKAQYHTRKTLSRFDLGSFARLHMPRPGSEVVAVLVKLEEAMLAQSW